MEHKTLRPGVYASYTVTPHYAAGRSAQAAAVAARAASHPGEVVALSGYAQAAQTYAAQEDAVLLEAIRRLFAGGVSRVYACAVAEQGYPAAFTAFVPLEDVGAVLCDSADPTVLTALRDSVQTASAEAHERLAVAAVPEEGAALTAAAACNCERMLLCHGRTDGEGLYLAAGMAALLLTRDGADCNLNGAVLPGVSAVEPLPDNAAVERLLAGGVTPFELSGGEAVCVRAVTTRTTTAGTPDATWRDVSTILIIDEVLGAVRSLLKSRLRTLRSTPEARESVASQITVLLTELAGRGLLQDFEPPVVRPDPADGSVCLVELAFTVARVVSQIHIQAKITV